jgi:hypothetical protein
MKKQKKIQLFFINQTWSKGEKCRAFLQLATQTNIACQ